jgi:hypothetical protein
MNREPRRRGDFCDLGRGARVALRRLAPRDVAALSHRRRGRAARGRPRGAGRAFYRRVLAQDPRTRRLRAIGILAPAGFPADCAGASPRGVVGGSRRNGTAGGSRTTAEAGGYASRIPRGDETQERAASHRVDAREAGKKAWKNAGSGLGRGQGRARARARARTRARTRARARARARARGVASMCIHQRW